MPSSILTTVLNKRYVALTEGEADNNFLQKLIATHSLPSFAFPFPPLDGGHVRPGAGPYYGRDGFVHMLRALNDYFSLNEAARARVKGILIVTDTTDNPARGVQDIRRQIRSVGQFGVPATAQSITPSTEGFPSVSTLQVPCDGTPGGLETLCFAAVAERYQDQAACLTTFF
jgi:hypothetical protein